MVVVNKGDEWHRRSQQVSKRFQIQWVLTQALASTDKRLLAGFDQQFHLYKKQSERRGRDNTVYLLFADANDCSDQG